MRFALILASLCIGTGGAIAQDAYSGYTYPYASTYQSPPSSYGSTYGNTPGYSLPPGGYSYPPAGFGSAQTSSGDGRVFISRPPITPDNTSPQGRPDLLDTSSFGTSNFSDPYPRQPSYPVYAGPMEPYESAIAPLNTDDIGLIAGAGFPTNAFGAGRSASRLLSNVDLSGYQVRGPAPLPVGNPYNWQYIEPRERSFTTDEIANARPVPTEVPRYVVPANTVTVELDLEDCSDLLNSSARLPEARKQCIERFGFKVTAK